MSNASDLQLLIAAKHARQAKRLLRTLFRDHQIPDEYFCTLMAAADTMDLTAFPPQTNKENLK